MVGFSPFLELFRVSSSQWDQWYSATSGWALLYLSYPRKLQLCHNMTTFCKYQGLLGWLWLSLIRRYVIPSPSINMLKCPWAGYWTPNCSCWLFHWCVGVRMNVVTGPDVQVVPCMIAFTTSVWNGECIAFLCALKSIQQTLDCNFQLPWSLWCC